MKTENVPGLAGADPTCEGQPSESVESSSPEGDSERTNTEQGEAQVQGRQQARLGRH